MEIMKKQTINCDVKECKFNNEQNELCNLDSINVSSNSKSDICDSKKETICDSYENKKCD